MPDKELLDNIFQNNYKLLHKDGFLYKEKGKNASCMNIRASLLKMNYDVTTKCLHNKFHRKQLGKESQIAISTL